MMFDRGPDRQDIGEPTAAPRFVVAHPVVFVVLAYLALVACAALSLRAFGAAQGNPHDPRHWQTALIFAAVLAFPLLRSLVAALRRPRLPAAPRRR